MLDFVVIFFVYDCAGDEKVKLFIYNRVTLFFYKQLVSGRSSQSFLYLQDF